MNKPMAEYLANLQRRDKLEKANSQFFTEYSKVADRAVSAEVKLLALERGTSTESAGDASTGEPNLVAHLRSELDSARSELASTEKEKLEASSKATSLESQLSEAQKEIEEHTARNEKLARQVSSLTRRLKDRDLEYRETKKAFDLLQDEMLGLGIEKNTAERRMEDAEAQLRELEGRLMEWKRKEAEKMNEESKW